MGITIQDGLKFYLREHVRPLGQSAPRVAQMIWKCAEFFGKDRDVDTIERQEYRDFATWRTEVGKVRGPSIRRELSVFQAMVNHNHSEPRVPRCRALGRGDCPKPDGSQPRRRFLTQPEHGTVMSAIRPEEQRAYRWLQLAIHLGGRARALEELDWNRTDLAAGIIDLNVPGRRITNKRRAVLPIPKALIPMLIEWKKTAKSPDEPVIGYGPSGRNTSTHHLIKRVMVRAGIDEPGVCRHWTRKSFASWRIQAGHPLGKVAAALADRETTVEKSYAFILPEHLHETMNL